MKALLIVDMQYDFLPGGSLAVNEGDEIIPLINRLQKSFDFVVATQDWHPANHKSFAANHPGKEPGECIDLNGVQQVLWPVHCVQGSSGADFHSQLSKSTWKAIFQKGQNKFVDSYSAFFDNNRNGNTGLSAFLKEAGVDKLYVCGLALDYCVKFTVLDGLSEGFQVYLIYDASKAVNLSPDDGYKALREMEAAGAQLIQSEEFI
jgi:nicotinamidase/pyrazinamidase